MAKRSSTVNLEETIWNKINEYAEANNINRNKAIEWIVLQYEALNGRVITLHPTESEAVTEPLNEVVESVQTNIDLLDVSDKAYDDMPD
ncbi:hypothetical protein [Turicibacter sp.]|uniref:hypothetical protein n=1 Tax=Turicibacter sp. TaxID=2049042 RepID=UPI001B74CF44|nr:hypothetical protein [Turicibacter sp.]MBP3905233.1 hypothetical protein [Turicibacter sp.]